ncbi:MAG: ABC-2 family transporter protein [Clostridiaceae bacterium]|nr:ABC-2 family transporter protein [Clostridiaceae bacterium]
MYLMFARMAFREKLVYRVNTYLYILYAVFNLAIQLSVWYALYGARSDVGGVTLINMTTYVLISTGVSILTRSSVGNTLAEKVEDGSIEGDFVRPVSLKYYLMFETLGGAAYKFLFTFVPVAVVAAFLVPVQPPASILSFGIFLLSVVLGILLAHYINYTLGLLAFWFKRSIYVNWFLGAFFTLFGGTAVPLWFYPTFLKNIAMVLPFRFVTFEPISIYLGKTDLIGSVKVLAFQAAWIAALMLLERFIWAKAQKVVTIQGG